jgi:hypothetical protein
MIGRLPTTVFALVRSQKRWRELAAVNYLIQPEQEVVLPPSASDQRITASRPQRVRLEAPYRFLLTR